MFGLRFIVITFTELPVCNANSVDPDQTPRSVASDLGLHCLPFPFYRMLDINELRIKAEKFVFSKVNKAL